MIGKEETRTIVRKLFSWRSDRRSDGLSELRSLLPSDRSDVEESALKATTNDAKPGCGLLWLPVLVVVITPDIHFVWHWTVAATTTIAATLILHRRYLCRQLALAGVLNEATDTRLVPALLAHLHRMGVRSGPDSRGYQATNAALERLLPLVTEQDCVEWSLVTKQWLLDILEWRPKHAAIMIQALRLAPAIGDKRTLRCVAKLAEHPEWGGAAPAYLCAPLQSAARKCETELTASLARRKTAAQLLRACASPTVESSRELLRAATKTRPAESDVLLRAGSSAATVEPLIAEQRQNTSALSSVGPQESTADATHQSISASTIQTE